MKFQWIGGPTFLMSLGGYTLLSDPMFASGPRAFVMHGHPSTGEDAAPIARAGAPPAVNVHEIDAVIVSHMHSDHFDAVAARRLPKDLPVIAPDDQRDRLEGMGFRNVRGLAWWERMEYADGDRSVRCTAVPARHSADEAVDADLGVVNGYVIEGPNGSADRVYWTGDTVWFDGLREIRHRMGGVDWILPHIGAVGRDGPWGRMTLDAEEAVRLMDLFEPARCIPIHHHTFSHYVEPVSALEELVAGSSRAPRLTVLTEGEVLGS